MMPLFGKAVGNKRKGRSLDRIEMALVFRDEVSLKRKERESDLRLF